MCLIIFAWQIVPDHPFFAVANRDEFYNRPSATATWWEDHPAIFAPRDLQSGGTWLGFAKLKHEHKGYKFAALTNVREGSTTLTDAPSRGHLVSDFLIGNESVENYLQLIADKADSFNGFNLLVGEVSEAKQELSWFSNRNTSNSKNGQLLTPGIYGLSNGALDAPWPKVCKTKAELASLLCQRAPQNAYFEMLSNTQQAPDHRLPDTGVSLELERMLSATCIESELYGTRSSAVLALTNKLELEYHERIWR